MLPALSSPVAAQTSAEPAIIARSGAGVPWTDPASASGSAQLTYGHNGCIGIDVNNQCTGGEVGHWFAARELTSSAGLSLSRPSQPTPVPTCQRPPFKPCMRFSRTRLPDTVHRQACATP